MKIRDLSVGDAVRCTSSNRNGIVVKKWITAISKLEMYDVLFEDGDVVPRMPEHITHIVIRRDGVEINV
tara:strand:+ start:920 stop:1126 length:207 start_codon:yes stop_codon:yes gene_type:complete